MAILIKQFKSALLCICYLFISGFIINGQSDKGSAPWYQVKQLAEKTWCISDNGTVNIYLVEGNEKALLIDNGYGFANIRNLVKSMTKLPLTVVVTHGHRDHCGAVYQFPLVYAHPSDIDSIRAINTKDRREKNFKTILKVLCD